MCEVSLSIVIPTRDRSHYVADCTAELLKQASQFSDVEIIVVDNGSTDNTKEALTSIIDASMTSQMKYVYEGRQGSNIARNRGVRESTGKSIAIIDDDAFPHRHWVKLMRDHFLEARSEVVAGRVELRLDAPLPEWLPDSMGWILGKTEYGDKSRALALGEYPQSNNCAFTRTVFETLDGFNPNSLIYGDETEFFRRAEEAGFVSDYRHDIIVDHCVPPERLTKEGLHRKAKLWGRGSAYYWLLSGPNLFQRCRRIIEFASRIIYLIVRLSIHRTFPRAYTLSFDVGHLSQLLRGGGNLK